MTEILPELWIANKDIFEDIFFMNENNFYCIINCTKHNPDKKQIHIYIDTNVNQFEYNLELLNKLDSLLDYIHDLLCRNKSILIYCDDGCQLSAAIVAAYMIKYGQINTDIATEFIKSKKKSCFTPSNNFRIALQRFEGKK